eukprot:TRINITY_DN9559_c0_g1_i2.p1 TRINITY_DN9559_c0_g1~~TRINITY_DN9559_c0_g1_i2.p1  ORF type:complete len:157 (+),score=27.11 TRINITY_DN9559_c0_g1_i2:172-642(+)
MTLRTKLLGPNHPSLAWSNTNLGNVMLKIGHYQDALRFFDQAKKIWDNVNANLSHPNCGLARHNIGVTLLKLGQIEKAQEIFLAALQIREKHLGPTHTDVADSCLELGKLYTIAERYEEAAELLERASSIRSASFGPNHKLTYEAIDCLRVVQWKL